MAGGEAAASLAPGFRFHPTDEELVRFYLKRKVTNKPFRFDPISFLDIYKSEPWDLPGKAKLKSRDLEWYFFSVLDKKYGNGSKTNRATEKGYWKTTGKDRPVRWNSRTVGMKKTLVYHLGRAPRGERTNWVMHEYRLTDEELEKAGVAQDAFVLCRIFQKSGSGPKNGEQYGAPFVEEEWDNDDELAALPFAEPLSANEVVIQDDIYAETNDLDQNYDVQATFQNAVFPPNFKYGSSSHFVEHSADSIGTDLKPDGLVPQNVHNPSDGQNLLGILDQQEMDSKSVIDACGAQSCNNINGAGFNHYFDPYLVAADNCRVEDIYEQNNDAFNSGEPDSLVDSAGFDVVEEYLNFFDAEDENLTFDPSELIGNEDTALDEVPVSNKDVKEVNEVASVSSPTQTEMDINNNASSSKKKPEPVEYEPDTKNPYTKQASYLLGDILTPPAFASEFPVKGAALQLNAGESSTSVHVTAGVIRIESTGLGSNSLDLPFGKGREVDVVFSFGVSMSNPTRSSLVPTGSFFWGKARLLVPLSWLFLLFWTLVLSVTYKIGVCVCDK